MNNRTAIVISALIHIGVLMYFLITPKRIYTVPNQSLSVSMTQVIPVDLPEPPPEPPKEEKKTEKKLSEDLVTDIQEKLKKPTPKPEPTKTPTPVPTKKPTQKPTEKPSPKPKPSNTPSQKPSPTQLPTETPTPLPELIPLEDIAKLLTPLASPNPNESKDKEQTFDIIGFQGSDDDKFLYGKKLSAHLERNWRYPRVLPPGDDEYVTYVVFDIDKDGNVYNFKIRVESGWQLLDESVKEAVKRAEPVPKLPPTFGGGTITVQVPFRLPTNRRP